MKHNNRKIYHILIVTFIAVFVIDVDVLPSGGGGGDDDDDDDDGWHNHSGDDNGGYGGDAHDNDDNVPFLCLDSPRSLTQNIHSDTEQFYLRHAMLSVMQQMTQSPVPNHDFHWPHVDGNTSP